MLRIPKIFREFTNTIQLLSNKMSHSENICKSKDIIGKNS